MSAILALYSNGKPKTRGWAWRVTDPSPDEEEVMSVSVL